MIRAPTNGEVLLVLGTGLLDVHIHIANGPHHAGGLVHQPAGISIGHQRIGRLQNSPGGMDAFDILIGIATHLQLKPPIPFLAVSGNLAGHLLRRLLRDGAVQMKILPITPPE